MTTKIVSLNMERHKHFDKVQSFLRKEDREIACLMEVCENDLRQLQGDNYPYVVYAPNDAMPSLEGKGTTGVAILSKKPIENPEKFYCGEDDRAYLTEPGMGTHAPILITAQIGDIQLGAIHFTWTKDGLVDNRQRKHVEILLNYLKSKGEIVVCGDFNIPRPNEMYLEIAKQYKDNIPPEIVTTLDPDLHRANFVKPGKLKFVVDYAWTSPRYSVFELQVVKGVSDHCAIIFSVEQN